MDGAERIKADHNPQNWVEFVGRVDIEITAERRQMARNFIY